MTGVRVRFPPSPTGYCHVGTARMGILNFLFARKSGGTIVFRSEDTDKERSKPEFEKDIQDSFTWLGLSWDEFYRQSERTDIYREQLHTLIASDKAYVSEEESKKEAGTRVMVIRLRNPGTKITFTDILRGEITFDTTELGDFAIARSENDPLYHFAVVVDDAEMRITHVIRGEDHISNTPRQILIQEALGFERPAYAHYPLHLAADRSKLSKRKGDVSVRSYREQGYLPEALANYLATLGWTPPSHKEILSMDEMIAEFDLTDVHKSSAVFDVEKLKWFNREYLLRIPDESFATEALAALKESLPKNVVWSEAIARTLVPILRERIHTYGDIKTLAEEGEFDYYFEEPILELGLIPEKKSSRTDAKEHLSRVAILLQEIPEKDFTQEKIKDAIWPYATEKGRGAVLWPLRYSLTGKEKSPDPFTVAMLLGKAETERRVSAAVSALDDK